MALENNNFPKIENDSETTLLKLMERVDNARASFILASSKYNKLPTDNSLEFLYATAHDTEYAVRRSIDFIITNDQDTLEEKFGMIATLMNEDSEFRTTHFSNLVGDMGFIKIRLSSDAVAGYIQDLIEDDDEFDDPTDEVMQMYVHYQEMDLDTFIRTVKDGASAKRLRIASAVGRQVLEVAKVAAAAGIATWLVNRNLRKN